MSNSNAYDVRLETIGPDRPLAVVRRCVRRQELSRVVLGEVSGKMIA